MTYLFLAILCVAAALWIGHTIVSAKALITAWRRRATVAVVVLPGLVLTAWVIGIPMPWQIPTSIIAIAALVLWRRYGDTAGLVTRWGETARRKSGVASDLDILRHGSALALRRKVGVLRPGYTDLSRWQKLRVPAREFATPIAKVGTSRRVWASVEDVLLIFGGPRRGKSGWLAGRILDAPGAVIAASTRADLIKLTWQLRSRRGPVMVFDAVGHGGANDEVPPNAFVQFDPLTGCEDPNGAAERAADLISAGRSDGGSDSERDYWYGQGARVLEAMLHAAALGGRTMSDVLTWVADPEQHRATMSRYLRLSRQNAYVQDIGQFCETNDKTRSSITSTIMPALGWLTSPAATAAATPGASINVEQLIRSRTTLYLLGEKETKSGPLVAAVNGYIVREARRIANRQPTGRLDPTLTMVCDEAGQLAPPLEDLTADMGGRGVQIIAAFQSHAQMLDRWSHDQAAVIMNNAGSVVVFGGTKDNADRKYWSELCGERDEVVETTDPMGKVKARTVRKVPVFAPAIIGGLPDKRVIVIHTGMPPVVGKVQMAWDRRDYRRMRKELAGGTTLARTFWIPARRPEPIPTDDQAAA